MCLKPKKSLGQHFLIDPNIKRKIISNLELKITDKILEIGSGQGELTLLIAPLVSQIYALEIDPKLCKVLKENLKDYKNVRVIQKDILKFNFKNITKKIRIIGNIPYYITSPIIEHLIKYRQKIKDIYLTVQKDFAQRITAVSGSKAYGAFSIFVQYYTKPKILFTIKKTCFYPQPKVDSCFLKLLIRKNPAVVTKNENLFFRIVRKSFKQRRKTLRNSLAGLVAEKKLRIFFDKYGINPNIRPECLSLEDFAHLVNL